MRDFQILRLMHPFTRQEAALSQGRPRDAASCTFRYVSNFTTASWSFSATARLSCILHSPTSATVQMLKLHTVRWFSRQWCETQR